MSNYNFFIIFITTLGSYFFSLFLVKIKKINLVQHRHFWNIILLITFLVSGILGLFLAFSIDQKLSLRWYLPVIWYHVEFGIVMALVAIFHSLWHLPYFSSLFKKLPNNKN